MYSNLRLQALSRQEMGGRNRLANHSRWLSVSVEAVKAAVALRVRMEPFEDKAPVEVAGLAFEAFFPLHCSRVKKPSLSVQEGPELALEAGREVPMEQTARLEETHRLDLGSRLVVEEEAVEA